MLYLFSLNFPTHPSIETTSSAYDDNSNNYNLKKAPTKILQEDGALIKNLLQEVDFLPSRSFIQTNLENGRMLAYVKFKGSSWKFILTNASTRFYNNQVWTSDFQQDKPKSNAKDKSIKNN